MNTLKKAEWIIRMLDLKDYKREFVMREALRMSSPNMLPLFHKATASDSLSGSSEELLHMRGLEALSEDFTEAAFENDIIEKVTMPCGCTSTRLTEEGRKYGFDAVVVNDAGEYIGYSTLFKDRTFDEILELLGLK